MATQLRLRHGLAWILAVSWAELKLQDWLQWFAYYGRDETLGGPEESRWTKSWQICIRMCVQSTHVYIYAGKRDEI